MRVIVFEGACLFGALISNAIKYRQLPFSAEFSSNEAIFRRCCWRFGTRREVKIVPKRPAALDVNYLLT